MSLENVKVGDLVVMSDGTFEKVLIVSLYDSTFTTNHGKYYKRTGCPTDDPATRAFAGRIATPDEAAAEAEKRQAEEEKRERARRLSEGMLKATWHFDAPTRIYCVDMDYVELEFEGRRFEIREAHREE